MAYIVKAYRSAVGKAGRGGFSTYRSDDLAVEVIQYLMAQALIYHLQKYQDVDVNVGQTPLKKVLVNELHLSEHAGLQFQLPTGQFLFVYQGVIQDYPIL